MKVKLPPFPAALPISALLLLAGSLLSHAETTVHFVDMELIDDPSFNRIDLTLNPTLGQSSSDTTTLTGDFQLRLNIDSEDTATGINITGEGLVEASDTRFNHSGFFSYDIRVENLSGPVESLTSMAYPVDPTTGIFAADNHRVRLTSGSISGSFAGESINESFSESSPLNVRGEGDADLELQFVSEAGGIRTYNVILTLPVDIDEELEDGGTVLATVTGNGTLRAIGTIEVEAPADPFTDWVSDFSLTGEDSELLADPDGDGVPNLLEFVLDGDPSVPGTANLPEAEVNQSGDFVFSFVRRADSVDAVELIFEHSTDLSDWSSQIIPSSSSGNVSIDNNSPSTGLQTVTVTVPAASIPEGRAFGRIRAELQ